MYQVFLTKRAQNGLRSLSEVLQKKCRTILKKLEKNPHLGKTLAGQLAAYRSIRLATYRVIYRIEKRKLIILVVSIRHRKDAYRRLS